MRLVPATPARQPVINISLGIIERYVLTMNRIVTVTRTANRIVEQCAIENLQEMTLESINISGSSGKNCRLV